MNSPTYVLRRGQLETYFDRTAVDAWARLTSNAPVSGIRATVRAGREQMRATLLDWLPQDLRGRRLLDAGCGTGALAAVAASRGATVVAIDLSPRLIDVARQRIQAIAPSQCRRGEGSVEYRVGDMADEALGNFDHVIAMDSLIHYRAHDMARVVAELARRTTGSVLFSFAPRTALLSVMHAVGRLFPRADRAPQIEPVRESALRKVLRAEPALRGFRPARCHRVAAGFYISQALELVRA